MEVFEKWNLYFIMEPTTLIHQRSTEMSTVTPLYGGAITTLIPAGFLDASMLREVPDTQEVFVNSRSSMDEIKDGLGLNESIIVDLLQRVEASDDREALQFHLKEISDLNGSTEWKLLIHETHTKNNNGQTCIMLETAYKWGKVAEKENVVSCIGLIRLEDVETDVLITVNVPLDQGNFPEETMDNLQHGKIPPRVTMAYNHLVQMVHQFTVKDKALFA